MTLKVEPRTHLPLLSGWCDGRTCRRCPRPWRYFVTGMELTRTPGDNATFLHDATEDHRGKPTVKLTRARWRRVSRRHAAITAPTLLAGAAPWVSWYPLAGYTITLATWLAVWVVARWSRALRSARANREWIDPAAAVACRVLNIRYVKRRARQMIQLPDRWGTGDETDGVQDSVRVLVPAGTVLSAGVKRQFVENVGARLGIPHPRGEWREAGSAVSVDILATPVPPKEVTLASLMRAVNEAADEEMVLGRGAGQRVTSVSLAEDSPHVLLSGSSGTGKSVLARFTMAQRLRRGDGVVILDPKRWSHWRWAGGGKISRDKVIYAYRTEDLHNTWLAIGREQERRIELDEDELAQVRRVFILVEEINTQTKRLTRYWKGERRRLMNAAKAQLADAVDRCEGSVSDGLALAITEGLDEADLDPPATSPAIVAMQESVGMGRELKMHIMAAAQRASAAVFGGNGGDIRESFQGGRIVAKWDRKLWKMLMDTIDYVACPTGPRGIWGIGRGETFEIFRVPFVSEAEALAMATSGPVATGPVLGGQYGGQVIEHEDRTAPAITAGVKLSDAVASLPGMSLDSLRRASTRDRTFPTLVGHEGQAALYDLDELLAWRERAR